MKFESNIYISRKVLNSEDITRWAKEQGFVSTLPPSDFHITQVYCKDVVVDWTTIPSSDIEMLFLEDDDHERSVELFNVGACVLEVHSDELIERSDELAHMGIKSKFPDYRSHITITYKKPDALDIANIEPYRGPIILGPETWEPIGDSAWEPGDEPLLESFVEGITDDDLYNIFADSYTGSTGSAWTREKFMSRARNWKFYGDDTGFVAIREQASGMRKLVAVAGDTKGITKGLVELTQEGKPVWGAVSEKLARASRRFGFIAPHTTIGGPLVIKAIMASIPVSVFGGVKPRVNPDGGIAMDYEDTGSTIKYMIANREYFDKIAEDQMDNFPNGIRAMVRKFLKILK